MKIEDTEDCLQGRLESSTCNAEQAAILSDLANLHLEQVRIMA
jgi:hypothetical protein